jgi:hypothetical protein
MRHRILHDYAAHYQVLEQASHRRQAPFDGAREQPGLTVLDPYHFNAAPRLPLRPDERQHIRAGGMG